MYVPALKYHAVQVALFYYYYKKGRFISTSNLNSIVTLVLTIRLTASKKRNDIVVHLVLGEIEPSDAVCIGLDDGIKHI